MNKLDDTQQLQSDINHKLTIIGISETWLNDKSESLIQLPDYLFMKNFRKKKTGRGRRRDVYINKYEYKVKQALNLFREDILESVFTDMSINGKKVPL